MHTLFDTGLLPALPMPAPERDDGRALYVRGMVALRDARYGAASSLLIRALRRQPAHLGMRRNLVRALLGGRQFAQLVPQADVALAAAPDDAELHFARGTALRALGKTAAACAAFNRAVTLQPADAHFWLAYGDASADLDNLTAAENLYRTAARLARDLPEAHAGLALALLRQGHPRAAVDAANAAIELHSGFAQAHWVRALALLTDGDFKSGFAAYEWRRRHPAFRAAYREMPGHRWDGGDPAGRTILVRAEPDAGEAIHLMRYLPLLHAMGARPVMLGAPQLLPLARSIPGVTAVAASDDPPAYDAWIDQMSLPGLLGTTPDNVPGTKGYIRADPALAAARAKRAAAGRKIGTALGDGAGPLKAIAAIGCEDLATRPGTSLAEIAAMIHHLDLVISVDEPVAHLAAAMGKPTWILLGKLADWRWMSDRADSPWYDSVRLFRQKRQGDWESVAQAIQQALDCNA